MIIDYDGQKHEFPDDFTDDDVSLALSGEQPAPAKITDYGDETTRLAGKSQYKGPEATFGEGLRSGLSSGARNILKSVQYANAAADKLFMGDEYAQEEFGKKQKLLEAALDPMAGKERTVLSDIGSVAGILPYYVNPYTAGGQIGGEGIKRAEDTISVGGTEGQAQASLLTSMGLNTAAVALPAKLVPGRLKNALATGATNVASLALDKKIQDQMRSDSGLPLTPDIGLRDYVVAGAAGSVMGGMLGGKQPDAKAQPGQKDFVTKPQSEYEATRISLINLDDSISKGEAQLTSLEKRFNTAIKIMATAERMGKNEDVLQQEQKATRIQQQIKDLQQELSEKRALAEKNRAYVEANKSQEEVVPPTVEPLPKIEQDTTPEVPIEQRIARLEQVSERLNNPPPDFDAKEAAVVWKKTTEALTKETDEELRATLQIVQKQAEDMLANEELVTSKVNGNYIDTLDVDPELQGHGLGAMKVKSLEADMLRQKHKEVTVLAKPESVGFWEKQGYTKSPQADLSGNVLMTKKLGKDDSVTGIKIHDLDESVKIATWVKNPDGTMRVKTPQELLDAAARHTTDPELGGFIDMLRESLAKAAYPVRVAIETAFLEGRSMGAAFSALTRKAYFKDTATAVDIVHEFFHAAVNESIIRVATGDTKNLLPATIRSAKNTIRIYEAIKIDPNFKDFHEGLDNPTEVISYMSDPNFRILLERKLSTPRWKVFVNDIATAIARTLGISKESEIRRFKGNYQQFLKDTESLVFTSLGHGTPKEMIDKFNQVYERLEGQPTGIRAAKGQIADLTTLGQVLPAKDVLDIILKEGETGSLLNQSAAFLQGSYEVKLFNPDSVVIGNTYNAIKKADGTFESAKRFFLHGNQQASGKVGPFMKLTNLHDTDSYEVIFKQTAGKDMLEAAPMIVKANAEGLVDIMDHPDFAKLSPTAKRLVESAVKVLDRIHKYKARLSEALGAKADPHKTAFWPHVRGSGDYGVQMYYKNGLPAEYRRFRTEAERTLYIETFQKHDPSVTYKKQSVQETREADAKRKEEETLILKGKLELLAEQHGQDTLEYRTAAAEAEKQAYLFGGHHMEQGYQPGFKGARSFISAEKNARDLFEAVFDHADEIARMARNAELRQLTDGYLGDDVIKQHELGDRHDIQTARDLRDRTLKEDIDRLQGRSGIEQTVDNFVGILSAGIKRKFDSGNVSSGMPQGSVIARGHGALTTMTSVVLMTSKPIFHVGQAISAPFQTIQFISQKHKTNLFDATDSFARGMYHLVHDGTGSEFHGILARASTEHHTFQPTTMNDITRIQLLLKDWKKTERAANAAGSYMSGIKIGEFVETFSRYISSGGVYAHGKYKLGLKGEALYTYVVNGVDEAMGLFQKDKKAPIISQTGLVGDFLSPITTYSFMIGNWTVTALRDAIMRGQIAPLLTLMATSILAGGLPNSPLIAEYEFVRTMYNDFQSDEEAKLPSAVYLVLENAKTGNDTLDVGVEMGLPSMATTAVAKAAGADRGIDVPGIRYSPFIESSKGSESIADNFLALSFAQKAGQNAFQMWKSGGTDSEIKKFLQQTTLSIPQRVLNSEVFLPPAKGNEGEDILTIGKSGEQLASATGVDRIAKAMGTRSTEELRQTREFAANTQRDKEKNQEINHAMQVFFDAKIRQLEKNEGMGLGDRQGMALKRLESLGKKYPDEANTLAKIQEGWQGAVEKKKVASIVRRLRAAGPHERKRLAEDWAKQTNRELILE